MADKKTLEQLEAELAAAERLKLSQSDILSLRKQIAQVQSDLSAEYIKEASLMEDLDEDAKSILATEQEKYELQQKRIKELDVEIDRNKRLEKAVSDQAKKQEKILDNIEKMGKGQKNFLQEIAESGVAAEDLAKSLAKAVKNVPSAVISKGYSATKQSIVATTLSVDSARASFIKMTGSMQTSIADVKQLYSENRNLAVTMGELFATAQELGTSMTAFSTASRDGRNAMTEAAIGASRLGVSAGQAGQAMNLFRTQFAQSGEQAAKTMNHMTKLAVGMKIPPAKFIGDLIATGPKLASYGKKAGKVFAEMAAQAKQAGQEVGTLIDYASKFDEFDKASEVAGKLNAALGGNFVDSFELMRAPLEERPKLIKQAVAASGIYFDGLDRISQMHIMAAAGFDDHALGMSQLSEAQRKSQKEMKAEAAEAERVAKFQEAASDAMTKLTAAGQSLAIAFTPAIDILQGFANALLAMPTWVIQTAGVAFLALGFAFSIVLPLFTIIVGLMKLKLAKQLLSNTATIASIGLKNAEALASTGQAAA